VESKAGNESRFKDDAYTEVNVELFNSSDLPQRLLEADIILKVSRPHLEQEKLIHKLLLDSPKPRLLIGMMQPLGKVPLDYTQYSRSNINILSLDNIKYKQYHGSSFEQKTPDLNVYNSMRTITGRLAFEECLRKTTDMFIRNLCVGLLGIGTINKAALDRAIEMGTQPKNITVYSIDDNDKEFCESQGVVFVNYSADLVKQTETLCATCKEFDILIAAAYEEGSKAPLIVTREVLKTMKSMSVVCDLARSEGGNISGSKDDTTLRIEGVIVTNTSSYAKRDPN